MQYFSFHHRDTEGTEKRRYPAVIGKVPWLQELSRGDAETPRRIPAVEALAQRRRETH